MKLPTKHDLEVWAITAARGATKLEQELAASNLLGAAVLYQSEYSKLKAYWATVAAATIAANPLGAKVIAITEVDGVPVSADVQAPGQTNDFPVRVDGCATLVPDPREKGMVERTLARLQLVRPVDEKNAEAKKAFDAAKNAGVGPTEGA